MVYNCLRMIRKVRKTGGGTGRQKPTREIANPFHGPRKAEMLLAGIARLFHRLGRTEVFCTAIPENCASPAKSPESSFRMTNNKFSPDSESGFNSNSALWLRLCLVAGLRLRGMASWRRFLLADGRSANRPCGRQCRQAMAARSNPVKPGQTRSNHFCTPIVGTGLPLVLPYIAAPLAQCTTYGGWPPPRARRRAANSQFPNRVRSNPVKPSQSKSK